MIDEEYRALTEGAGLVDFSHRTRIEVTGDDRASFLHNLTTNDVKGLSAGGGCEAFLLDTRGHVVGHVFLISIAERRSIVIETVAGENERLLGHLNRYLIREKVELHDRGQEWGELLLAGAKSAAAIAALSMSDLPADRLANSTLEVAGQMVTIVRVELTPTGGYLLLTATPGAQRIVTEALREQGAVVCGPEAFEAARIRAGFPIYGRDVNDKNLPQEVDRNDLAISFRKGCYLGQETVARIDALGHVNKTLVRLRFAGPVAPPTGTELVAGEVEVGQVTSAAFSPLDQASFALAYVRRGSNQPNATLSSNMGPAVILD
ncbi:MAG TPA: glycine cleavage T C-terminal barrel domain-containing protein [Pirellulales bacterium]|nr:glycine cleavage T C-terminal barrel domain-containing protein [Pirellulales bacterium]